MVGTGTTVWHLGHLGLFFEIRTYSRQVGQPAANKAGEDTDGRPPSSPGFSISLIKEEDGAGAGAGGEDDLEDPCLLFLVVCLSALSSADFTLSKVQTLW